MTTTPPPPDSQFQQKIYEDLNDKLRTSSWNAGVSEAHGLLSGLACRGIRDNEIKNKMYLFQINDQQTTLILEGIFSLVCRDLASDGFQFNLLLPGEGNLARQAEEVSNWCQGFCQGFCHDTGAIIRSSSQSIQEVVEDMMTISNVIIDPADLDSGEAERDLAQIIEYLKVGVQLIYDELNAPEAPKHLH